MKCFGQVKFYGRIFRAGCQSDNSFSARFKRCPYRSAIRDSYTFPLQSFPSACGDAQTARQNGRIGYSLSGSQLRLHPAQVGAQTTLYRLHDNLRAVVTVVGQNDFFHRRIMAARAFDDDADFRTAAEFALPDIFTSYCTQAASLRSNRARPIRSASSRPAAVVIMTTGLNAGIFRRPLI